MNLSNCEVLPGVVIVDKDPKLVGRVKATVPTLFDNSTMPVEIMPWIYPLWMGHYQTYMKPRNGMKIWVLNNKDNYNEYWYLPFFELTTDVRDIVAEDEEVEILMSRNMGSGSHQIYHTQEQGFVTKNSDYIEQFRPDGTYLLKGESDESMELYDGKVKLGKLGTAEYYACRYQKLQELLEELTQALIDYGTTQVNTPYCKDPGQMLASAITSVQNKIGAIQSNTVMVD